jgi:hypothetical protein
MSEPLHATCFACATADASVRDRDGLWLTPSHAKLINDLQDTNPAARGALAAINRMPVIMLCSRCSSRCDYWTAQQRERLERPTEAEASRHLRCFFCGATDESVKRSPTVQHLGQPLEDQPSYPLFQTIAEFDPDTRELLETERELPDLGICERCSTTPPEWLGA